MKHFIEKHIWFFKLAVLIASAMPLVFVMRQLGDQLDTADKNNALGYGAMLEVVVWGFPLLASLYFFGIVGASLYSGTFARGVVDFLLYPRHFLKESPVLISRQKGLIANGEYKLAEKELCEMRLKRPAAPEVALQLAELHAVYFRSPETAVLDILYYLDMRKFRHHPLNLTIMMRYADFQQELGRFEEAAQLLENESGRLFYTPRERKVLRQRSRSLSGGDLAC